MDEKKLEKIAKKIVKIEEQRLKNRNNDSAEEQLEELISNLSIVDLMELDDYIQSKKLLNKKFSI